MKCVCILFFLEHKISQRTPPPLPSAKVKELRLESLQFVGPLNGISTLSPFKLKSSNVPMSHWGHLSGSGIGAPSFEMACLTFSTCHNPQGFSTSKCQCLHLRKGPKHPASTAPYWSSLDEEQMVPNMQENTYILLFFKQQNLLVANSFAWYRFPSQHTCRTQQTKTACNPVVTKKKLP